MTGPLPSDDYIARVEHAEKMIADSERAFAEMPEAVRTARGDQLAAAAMETRANLEGRAAAMGRPTEVTFGNKHRQMTLLLAGVIGTARCKHFEKTPAQPSTLVMSTRAQLCNDCAHRASRNPFRRPPVVVGPHQCDLCLGEPCEGFHSITVQLGPVLMIGDICDACVERLDG